MGEEPVPVRASDADRERVAERLRAAAGDGQLSIDELDERLNEAYAARTRAELEPLTADLQRHGAAEPLAPAGETTWTVRRGEGGSRWLIAIMGGCDRHGRWRLARRATSLNIMGGSDLDLTHVELADDDVELTVVAIMGGASIYVPKGLRVEVSEFAFMGGNDVRIHEEQPPAAGGPVLRLRLFSLMGGSDVKRGPKLTREERRELKRQRRIERHGRH
jgi:hypothetical protein